MWYAVGALAQTTDLFRSNLVAVARRMRCCRLLGRFIRVARRRSKPVHSSSYFYNTQEDSHSANGSSLQQQSINCSLIEVVVVVVVYNSKLSYEWDKHTHT